MAFVSRGGIWLTQIAEAALSGADNAGQLATTDTPAKTDLNIAVWKRGNVTDSGVPLTTASATHTEILTDSSGPIVEADGDFIYVLGVPN